MPVSAAVREAIADRSGGLAQGGDLTSAIVGKDDELFAVLELAEREALPDLAALPPGNYAFLVVRKNHEIVHAMRIGFPEVSNGLLAPFFAHQLIESGQLSAAELRLLLSDKGIRLAQCVAAESSFRIAKVKTATSSIFAYLGLTRYLLTVGIDGVFAHQNSATRRSFAKANIAYEPISTRLEIRTPSFGDPTVPDDRYWPILLPVQGHNEAVMCSLPEATPRFEDFELDLRTN